MNKKFLYIITFLVLQSLFAQVKVSGIVVDEQSNPVPFSNVIFKGSTEGTITDESGYFYLQSDIIYKELKVSFVGFENEIIQLERNNFNLKIILKESKDQLEEIKLYSGRVKKKGNPAIAILKKIWGKKRENGIYLYDRYEYDKYEKIEFDLNNIDDKFKKNRVFKGLELIFDHIDTSAITGKAYLPIFINESVYKIYGKNIVPKKRNEKIVANKNSGFSENQGLIAFVKQLYADYDIYDNYIKFFDKSFASPLSKLGPEIYNYVLTDSSFIDSKWCYNILFYPKRKNELTFKGDFWVNDTTYAIKEIQMYANKNANVNWVKEIYIEQEFKVLSDSVFLLKRDHFMSDFSHSKKDKSKGVYGKRTTLYNHHVFNVKRPEEYYKEDVAEKEEIYHKTNNYWSKNRQEKLSKDEIGIYKMLDTLQHIKKFKELTSVTDVLTTGYWNIVKGFDFGPVYSTIGFNDLEGLRLRLGGRTYFSKSDKWRFKGFLAYGFGDKKFKYGIEGKWLLEPK
ncbi:MAG: carboxypeptidase-like regulatory domain-containing protein, partial [Flavobacteriaceae bacterium]|nr:carboxypeptidase-like regulatory domain-containing protein [Flavobacteriaceae bacterium]